ncbi:MAG: hypothetical protein Q9184_005460 [Pyrenodesmia sp. 2 TL-2023]
MEGYSYGARHPSNGGQSYVYSVAPSLSNLDAMTRDFAHLGTSSGYGSYPQGPPRTSSLPQGTQPYPDAQQHDSENTDIGPLCQLRQGRRLYLTSPQQDALRKAPEPLASVPLKVGQKEEIRDRMLTLIDYVDAQNVGGSYNEQEPSLGNMQLNVRSYKSKLDPRGAARRFGDFYVRVPPHKFFVEGRVFIKLHTEDAGNTAADHSSFGFSIVSYGELAYSQLRRFVVIKAKPKENFCLCIPISTYSGKGAGKKGVDQKAHAIIYTGSEPPEKLKTEVGMNKSPIRVVPSRPDEKLDSVSRVNMGKMFTVEWNTKVKDIGQVDKASLVKLLAYWKQIINT